MFRHSTRRQYRMRQWQKRRKQFVLAGGVVVLLAMAGGYAWWEQRTATGVPVSAVETTPMQQEPAAPVPPPPKPEPPPPPPKPSRDAVIPPIENGLAPVISAIPTKQPVVFLTIDDGAHKHPSMLELVKKHNLKTSLFLTYNVIRDNPAFFKDFLAAGALVENHTITHRNLTGLSYDEQKQEICGQADKMHELYGRRPVLFRPPGGSYNDDTRRAAVECGMKAVVMWKAKANGGSMQYQVGNGLRAGDIVLMHFRPEFKEDLESFVVAMNTAGLHTDLLENWLAEEE